jgi:hypothetical protein
MTTQKGIEKYHHITNNENTDIRFGYHSQAAREELDVFGVSIHYKAY